MLQQHMPPFLESWIDCRGKLGPLFQLTDMKYSGSSSNGIHYQPLLISNSNYLRQLKP